MMMKVAEQGVATKFWHLVVGATFSATNIQWEQPANGSSLRNWMNTAVSHQLYLTYRDVEQTKMTIRMMNTDCITYTLQLLS